MFCSSGFFSAALPTSCGVPPGSFQRSYPLHVVFLRVLFSGPTHFMRCSSGFFSAALPTSCGVPPGSFQRPYPLHAVFLRVLFLDHYFLLFTLLYSAQTHNLGLHHLCADDTQNYLTFATPDTNCSLNQLRDWLQNVSHLMTDSKLKLNTEKTEFLIIGSSVVNLIVW